MGRVLERPCRRFAAAPRSGAHALTTAEPTQHLRRYGANALKARNRADDLTLLLGQFRSSLILIPLFAAVLSFFLRDSGDTAIILAIVLASGLLGLWQERGAAHAVEKLLRVVQTTTAALRDGAEREVPVVEIVLETWWSCPPGRPFPLTA